MKGNAIKGQVVNLLNEREIAINVGSDDGVEPKMKFKILAKTPFEMRDPVTDDVLGVVYQEKTRVQVVEVQPRLSICQTYRSIEEVPTVPLVAAYGESRVNIEGLALSTRVGYEKLRADETAALPPLEGPQRYIRRGDRVVQLTYEDE